MTLYEKLPAATRDAILTEAAAFSTMLEGMDESAAVLWKKAAALRRVAGTGPQSNSSKKAANSRKSS